MSHQLEHIDTRYHDSTISRAQESSDVHGLDLSRRQKPFHVYKQEQGRFARRRLYPVTLFYLGFTVIAMTLGLRSPHPIVAVFFFIFGFIFNSFGEYVFHRWIL